MYHLHLQGAKSSDLRNQRATGAVSRKMATFTSFGKVISDIERGWCSCLKYEVHIAPSHGELNYSAAVIAVLFLLLLEFYVVKQLN
jgi:hypothetical protein